MAETPQADIRAGRRTAAQYAAAFADVAPRLSRTQALVEAERCLYCHDAPCVQACPTATLSEKSVIEMGQPEHSVVTTCAYCGVGCSFKAEMKGNTVVRMVRRYWDVLGQPQVGFRPRDRQLRVGVLHLAEPLPALRRQVGTAAANAQLGL